MQVDEEEKVSLLTSMKMSEAHLQNTAIEQEPGIPLEECESGKKRGRKAGKELATTSFNVGEKVIELPEKVSITKNCISKRFLSCDLPFRSKSGRIVKSNSSPY